jgi:serine/threonine-protein kinase
MGTPRFLAPRDVLVDGTFAVGSVFWVAQGQRAGVRVAVKRLKPRMQQEPRAHEALQREVDTLGRAHHWALPALLDHGSDAAGPFIVQTWAEGQSLARLVARGPIPPTILEPMARGAFAALAEIHALSDAEGPLELALGDLSPEDLVLGTQPGSISFVDLGQASFRGAPSHPDARGTVPFAPPEVTAGEVRWSQASDVYALAALLVLGAVGEPPCETRGPARLVEIAERGLSLHAFRRVSGLSPRLVATFARATAWRAADRLATAAEISAALLASEAQPDA